MRASRLFIHTQREDPAEAELTSHRLMQRAGMIQQLAAGIFSWLPLGWRTVRKVKQIVREEMDAAGAAEIMMPAVQPAELWQESGRWQVYGPELLRLRDRHERDYCVGPTHEEVVTALARAKVSSWRHLPFNLYQIQTKFRDEIRPRFGIMRAREFIMKDAYSFDVDAAGAQASYQAMRAAYVRIFDRLGLDYRVVAADSGAIGGSQSEEFLVLADNGEAVLAYTDGNYAANLDQVPCTAAIPDRPLPARDMAGIDTPGVESIEQLRDFLLPEQLPMDRYLKTMVVTGEAGMAAILLAGDATLNLAKASAQPEIGGGARLAEPAEAAAAIGADFGSLGPVNMPLPVIADHGVANSADFCCGANQDGKHLVGCNFGRDCPEPRFADLRMVQAGELAPDGKPLQLRHGIEVGHVFYLGTKYSTAMQAVFETENTPQQPIEMGCYGIGITRIVAAAIEQNHDDRGIAFPVAIAPFALVVLPLGKEEEVQQVATRLYHELLEHGVDALLDDRGLRAGNAFADLELLGIPYRVVVSKRSLASGGVEFKARSDAATTTLPLEGVTTKLLELAFPGSAGQRSATR